jgi:MoaA/NifB/PqqE/SkfB family radical SAM enzyme
MRALRSISQFGINYVVNSQTIAELDEAIAIAESSGAAEFLLLPEQPSSRGTLGIDEASRERLGRWVEYYQGRVRLSVSEGGAIGLPVCDPLAAESGLSAYAHIDASGVLKRSSFDVAGVGIEGGSVLHALAVLNAVNQGNRP